jgi:hypothetical protein
VAAEEGATLPHFLNNVLHPNTPITRNHPQSKSSMASPFQQPYRCIYMVGSGSNLRLECSKPGTHVTRLRRNVELPSKDVDAGESDQLPGIRGHTRHTWAYMGIHGHMANTCCKSRSISVISHSLDCKVLLFN